MKVVMIVGNGSRSLKSQEDFKKIVDITAEKISHTNFKDLKSYLDESIEKLYKEALEIVKKELEGENINIKLIIHKF